MAGYGRAAFPLDRFQLGDEFFGYTEALKHAEYVHLHKCIAQALHGRPLFLPGLFSWFHGINIAIFGAVEAVS